MARNEKLTVLEAIRQLQAVIEQKKASLHQLRGEEKALLNQLEEQFGLLDIKEAEKRLTEIKREQEGVMSLLVFAVLLMTGIVIYSSIRDSTTSLGSTTAADMAIGNVSANTWGAFSLVSVGPIIFGAVIILGIVSMLYLKR